MDGERLIDPATAHDRARSDEAAVGEDMIRADFVRADLGIGNADRDNSTAAEVIERARHTARQIGSRAVHSVETGMHALKDPDTRRKVATTVGASAAVVVSGVSAVAGVRRAHNRKQPSPPANFYGKIRGMVNEKLK
jgi:hypothetical protein